MPKSQIIGINGKSNPKTMIDEILDGPEKGKKETTAYEFVGLKLKLRSTSDGKSAPKSASYPEEGSKDSYIELEKILTE